MDFKSTERAAKAWVTSSKTRFEIIDVDPEQKKIIFGSTSGNETFYIVGPDNTDGALSWHVWSDADDVLTKLNDVIDSLQSCKQQTLIEILNSVNRTLASLQGGAAALADSDDSGNDEDEDDEDDEDDAYYEVDDMDAIADDSTTSKITKDETENDSMYLTQGSPTAVKRLLKDWNNMKGSEKYGISANPRGENLFVWDVKFLDIPKKSRLGKDLQEYSKKFKKEAAIFLEMIFPANYPMEPPFVRIIRPRFEFLTGHVTLGGSICMELLTRSGWRPTNDIENLLVQIRTEILSDPKAGLDSRNMGSEYDKMEAQRAFDRMVHKYGWGK